MNWLLLLVVVVVVVVVVGGSKPEYLEKSIDNQSGNRYHITKVKTDRPNRASNPRPNVGDKLTGWGGSVGRASDSSSKDRRFEPGLRQEHKTNL